MKKSGTFEYQGEWFAYGPCEDDNWIGFTEVLDKYDFVMSTAATPALAIRAAKYEVDWAQDEVTALLNILFAPEETS
jgi:hypothetical protein